MISLVGSGRGFSLGKGGGAALGIGEPHFDTAIGWHTEPADEPGLVEVVVWAGVAEDGLDELVGEYLFVGRPGLVEFGDVEAGVAAAVAVFLENDIAGAAAWEVEQYFAAVPVV